MYTVIDISFTYLAINAWFFWIRSRTYVVLFSFYTQSVQILNFRRLIQQVINLKSELYRFATIGDKILIALALIAASGVGISQSGDHWNKLLSVITH